MDSQEFSRGTSKAVERWRRRKRTIRHNWSNWSGEFDAAPGSVAQNVAYKATVEAEASEAEIADLMRHTDTVAEIQNTLRQASTIQLVEARAVSYSPQ